MAEQVSARPAICLNMIVRNEAHIVHEVLHSVAPYITSWVIVDTGSHDGTQDVIKSQMASLGIPGELHERPWRDFGHNRSEALTLAQGHGDYIWVMDADDTVMGAPDFSGLQADVYAMRINDGLTYWRRQLFRDGLPWRYVGVVHEYADCGNPFAEERLGGDYHIESRRLGARNADPQKYERDRDLLLADLDHNPDNERSVFYLAESYFNLGDFANARDWAARRAEMGGWAEEIYYAMWQVAQSMSRLDEPWPDVEDAYLRAWEFRPTRAEPLHAIATRYRTEQRYQLGYFFAARAAEIPLPDEDILFVAADVYHWRALDEKAICASWIGKHAEAFALCRRILARPDIPDDDRRRIAGNRDFSVPVMIDAASSYPDALVHRLVAGPRDGEVTVSLVAGPDPATTEQTLNSFLHCCSDVQRVGRFLVLDAGLIAQDRATLLARYPFLELIRFASTDEPLAELSAIHDQIQGQYWLHLGQGWRFFAPEPLIARLTAVLDAEPEVVQVGINLGDAPTLTAASAAENAVRRAADAGRYVLTDTATRGPAMIETSRLDRAGALGPKTATLDEVLCVQQV
jgi:glycosyltransferase involved in cell wall biosynthesis